MTWFRGLPPEAQVTIVVGVLAIVVQPVFLFGAFLLGKAQARAQVRHQKAVEAIVEALRIIVDLRTELGVWALQCERDEVEMKYAKEVLRLNGELRDLVSDNSPWFEPQTQGKLNLVLKELSRHRNAHYDALKSGDKRRAKRSGKQLYEWHTKDLTNMQLDLEDEARRLIGTKRHWTRTRGGKPLVERSEVDPCVT